MAGCPDAETLAAYLDGQLFPEQRDRVEEHAAGCDACATVLAEAIRFQCAELGVEVDGETETAARGGLGTPARWAAAAALAMVAGAVSWGLVTASGWSPLHLDPRQPLIAATARERPMVPRLTGGFRWAESEEETWRAVSARPSRIPWGYYAAAEKVRKAAVVDPSADRLGALADALLLAGDLDRALVTLARAAADDPTDPRLRSDFAAAYLARGKREGTAADLAAAVELASSALAADPSLVEARFNRALALQELHLDVEARRAWESYLREEPDPRWAAEARQHLRDVPPMQRPIPSTAALRRAAETGDRQLPELVATHRFSVRRLVEWELLPEWGAALAAGDRGAAARALAAAAAITRVHSSQTGERRLEEQVAEAVAARGAAARRLAAAHRALAAGERAIERLDGAAAREALTQAVSTFAARGVGWRRATTELLVAEYVAKGVSDDLTAAVQRRAALGGDDLVTRARLGWLQGMVAAHRAEVGQAISHYLEAFAALDRIDETEPAAWIQYLLSEVYTLAGDERSTWKHRADAVAATAELADRRRSYGILLGAAVWSVLGGRPWLADAFLDELAARGYDQLPYERAQLLVWRARVSLLLGDRHAGATELAHAALATRAVEPAATRARLAAELSATRGIAATSPDRAVAALSKALATFRDRGTKPRLPGLLLQRAHAYRAAGDPTAAERDLRAGIALLEEQPRLAHRDEVWITRLDGAHTLYDQMIALELERGRDDQAFLWSERARRRALAVNDGSGGAVTAAPPSRIGRELDAATTLLSYALVGDRALLWRVDSRGAKLVSLPATAREISSWVGVLDADLAAGEWTAHTARVARRLHRALVAPARLARGTHRLIIVPDKSLSTLPFSALLDETGAFLVESFTVETAPSAAFYLHARDRWRALAADRPSALALGDPDADEQLFPGLPPLPGAADEAHQVAALYSGSSLITGKAATREALLAGLGKHPIVHLATHALVDDASPSRSALALAARRAGDGTGALFADEIPGLGLGRTRTVVLASCGGSAGPLAAAEGRLSLPRAFLAANVPTVIAALWPVGDRRSVELLTGLHTRLRAGDDPASALRTAQLRLLASSDPRLRSPATWALFQALGG